MPQSAELVIDHNELFRGPEYKDLMKAKKTFENAAEPCEVERVREWMKTPEYQEKNFARERLARTSCCTRRSQSWRPYARG